MNGEADQKHARVLERLSRASGWPLLATSLLVLLGWSQGWDRALHLLPDRPAMAPNTAVALAAFGAFLAFRRRSSAAERLAEAACGFTLIVIGALALGEALWSSGPMRLNHALAWHFAPAGAPLGHGHAEIPAAITALSFALLGFAVLLQRSRPLLSQWLTLLEILLPVTALVGGVFHFPAIYLPFVGRAFDPMAENTALCLFAGSLGLLARDRSHGLIQRFLSPSAAGDVYRILGLAVLSLPFLLGITGTVATTLRPEREVYVHSTLALAVIGIFLLATALALRALDKSEEKYRSLIENAFDPILIVDDKGKIEFANRQLTQTFGYSAEELVGHPVEMLVPDGMRADAVRLRNRFLSAPVARAIPADDELRALRKDGTELAVDVSLTPVRLGYRTAITAVVRDVTERRRLDDMQRFLAESARVMNETIDYDERIRRMAGLIVPRFADLCVAFFQEGDKPKVHTIVHRDPAMAPVLQEMCELYPSPGTERIGGPATEAKTLFVRTLDDEAVRRLARSADHRARIERIGASSFMTVPLNAREKTIGVLALARMDPARRFSREEAVALEQIASRFAIAIDNARLYKDMKQAVRIREDILAIVSHDLKNPIAVIDISCQLLPMKIDAGATPAELKDMAARIRRGNRRMRHMVQGLLNFGKLESGTFAVQPALMQVAGLFGELAELFGPLAEQANVSLVFHNLSDISFEADADALFQALANLIGNALKFTPAGGSVGVSCVPSGAGNVCIQVQDTGPGIPPALHEKIFERYWQAKGDGVHGAGLGLYIAKGIVEAHHGRIRVSGEPGHGACFTIEVPRRQPEARSGAHAAAKPRPPRPWENAASPSP